MEIQHLLVFLVHTTGLALICVGSFSFITVPMAIKKSGDKETTLLNTRLLGLVSDHWTDWMVS